MVPLAPSFRDSTLQPEPRMGGSNWATSPCSRYRSPPQVELSKIWLEEQLAKKEPVRAGRNTQRYFINPTLRYYSFEIPSVIDFF